MTLLICNIGSSDLNWYELPELRGLSERERGTRLLAEAALLTARLQLPIIAKALRHARRRGPLTRVVLIASDQGAEPGDEAARSDWAKDTIWTAQVVARLLEQGIAADTSVPGDRIAIWLIGEDDGLRDPSDYDGVRRFFERRLPGLAAEYPAGPVFLEVTGGTPAMTTGLLIAGSEVFGERAEALYVHPRQPMPATLNTSRRLAAGPLRATLLTHAENYNYEAALSVALRQSNMIGERLAAGAHEVLEALLVYAARRFNFDFPEARAALEGGVDRAGDGRWRPALMELYQQVHAPQRAALLEEVYHGAAARYATGAYADFLTQVVRFQENAFRTLCLDRGAVFRDRNGQPLDHGSRIDRAWAAAQGFPLPNDYDGTSRAMLQRLARHLAVRNGEAIEPTFKALAQLEALAYLRNDLTHSFIGVHKRDLAQRFSGNSAAETDADAILPHLAACLELVVGRAPGDSPYWRINGLIRSLLREA